MAVSKFLGAGAHHLDLFGGQLEATRFHIDIDSANLANLSICWER